MAYKFKDVLTQLVAGQFRICSKTWFECLRSNCPKILRVSSKIGINHFVAMSSGHGPSDGNLVLPPDDVGGGEDCFLPPDDDGDDTLFQPSKSSTSNAPAPKAKGESKPRGEKKNRVKRDATKAETHERKRQPKAEPNPKSQDEQAQVLPWNDDRLKDAAQRYPSTVCMPFQDLRQLFDNPPPFRANQCTLWEIYSLPRLSPVMRSLGGQSLRSYDIKHFMDLSQADYVRLLLQDVAVFRPHYLSLSPPCTMVCQLQASNWKRIKNAKQKYLDLEEALGHIDLTMWLAEFQDDHQAYYGFEHPHLSLAWGRESVTAAYVSVHFRNFDTVDILFAVFKQ